MAHKHASQQCYKDARDKKSLSLIYIKDLVETIQSINIVFGKSRFGLLEAH